MTKDNNTPKLPVVASAPTSEKEVYIRIPMVALQRDIIPSMPPAERAQFQTMIDSPDIKQIILECPDIKFGEFVMKTVEVRTPSAAQKENNRG